MSERTPVEAYPLCWPTARPRAKYRDDSRLRLAFARARDAIVREVRLLGGSSLVISTNIELRRDGLPYASFKTPDDAGVAVYFAYKKRQMCFACDRWRKVESNMQAIAKTIEALRGVARWGTGDMMEAAFTGFAALPDPAKRDWRVVLGIGQTGGIAEAKAAYRTLASQNHPDRGGDSARMTEINRAWDQAQEALGPCP